MVRQTRLVQLSSMIAVAIFLFSLPAWSQPPQKVPPKPATPATKAANAKVLKDLPFSDKQDFADAQRGFIDRPEKLTIKDASGKVIWDMEGYKKYIGLDKPAPDIQVGRLSII